MTGETMTGETMTQGVLFTPTRARFFERLHDTFQLTAEELALLERNGFVVSDRLSFEDFSMAYGYLFWKDLPVLITTDSLLQAVHQSYDDLLEQTELRILLPGLTTLLSRCRDALQVAWSRSGSDPQLAPLFADLEVYLAVPLALLSSGRWPDPPSSTPGHAAYLTLATEARRIANVALFGAPRQVDFSLFTPRGHYTKYPWLELYFRAMSWLAHIDLRLVDYDAFGQPTLHLEALAAALLLRDALTQAGQRPAWDELNRLFGALVGGSDNMTLPDLERFVRDAELGEPAAVLQHPEPARLLALLTSGAYGTQRIAGQLQASDPSAPTVPQPVSFLLLGQRFALDSWVLSQVVYDKLVVNGQKVRRTVPSPLDVWAALGNRQAAVHLETELTYYGYHRNLEALRQEIAGTDAAFWQGTLYHQLLHALRTLAAETTSEPYPPAMQSTAWADKMLQTQLAAWAQLRHDNLLYVKQSTTLRILCAYPAGYVEPYPAFYAALADYAARGLALFASLGSATAGSEDDPADDSADDPADELAGYQVPSLRRQAMDYFRTLGEVAGRLETLATKELCQEPFSQEEERWLTQPAVLLKAEVYDPVCGRVEILEDWAGWYTRLCPWRVRDQSPVGIADVHTDPPGTGNTGTIVHVATGPVALALVLVGGEEEGQTVYAGPAFTYYELLTDHPHRLTDEEWRGLLGSGRCPAAPAWTESFRWSDPPARERLALPLPEARRRRE